MDYIIEFKQVGQIMKVTAIDPLSTKEVSIVGDPHAGREALVKLAVQKLEYVLSKG